MLCEFFMCEKNVATHIKVLMNIVKKYKNKSLAESQYNVCVKRKSDMFFPKQARKPLFGRYRMNLHYTVLH